MKINFVYHEVTASPRLEAFVTERLDKIETKYDGIICGFCLPYLSQTDAENLIFDAKNLLVNNGLIYISFVEGDPNKSDFQIGSSGDRSYFYYHTLDKLKTQLLDNSFEDLKTFTVEYVKSETEIDIHTILTAKKKTTANR